MFVYVTVVGAGDLEEGEAVAGDGAEVVGALHEIRERLHTGRHVLARERHREQGVAWSRDKSGCV